MLWRQRGCERHTCTCVARACACACARVCACVACFVRRALRSVAFSCWAPRGAGRTGALFAVGRQDRLLQRTLAPEDRPPKCSPPTMGQAWGSSGTGSGLGVHRGWDAGRRGKGALVAGSEATIVPAPMLGPLHLSPPPQAQDQCCARRPFERLACRSPAAGALTLTPRTELTGAGSMAPPITQTRRRRLDQRCRARWHSLCD